MRTDALGGVTQSLYNFLGNRIRETDALGHDTTFSYDDNGRMLTETTTRTTTAGLRVMVTAHAYDLLGRETRVQAADGSARLTAYDQVGNRTAETDPLGRVTRFEYDDDARLTKRTYPDGTFETYGYDFEGRRTSSTDRGGRTTTFGFDKTGRPTTTTFADGVVTTRTYDAAGRMLTSSDPTHGGLVTYEYDPAGRQSKVTDALGGERKVSYDDAGQQTKMTDQRGADIFFLYDEAGRQSGVTFADGTQRATTYDLLGRKTADVDQLGRATQFGYDAEGRLRTVTDPLSQATAYAYDEWGNRISTTDAAGAVTAHEYDDLGRETRRTLADGKYETKEYDLVGRLAARTDLMGRRTALSYDGSDRLAERLYPDSSRVTFTHSATGQRLTAVDGRGVTAYEYDSRDRVTKVTDPAGHPLEYAYDARGLKSGMTVRVGAMTLTTSYAYDSLARLSGVTDPDGRAFGLEYDLAGNRTKLVRPNGVDTTNTWDTLGRLANIRTYNRVSNVTIASYAYTLAPTGQRTRIDEADGTSRAYVYDDLMRLTGEAVAGGTGPQYQKMFAYDAVSNRLAQVTTGTGAGNVSYTYDSRQRLLTENAASYTWDDSGNQISNAAGDTYTWDFDDRLVRVTRTDGTVADNTYDVDGVLVRTIVTPAGGGTAAVKNLLVDTAGGLSHVVAETDGAGTIGAYYVRAADELLAVRRGPVLACYLSDGLGSVRGLAGVAGSVTDTSTYSAFGELLDHTGSDAQPYGFAGEAFEPETALSYNRARWMDPRTGRFLSVDPARGYLAAPLTLNPYLYAGTDPVNRLDPSGLDFTLPGLGVSVGVGAVLGGLATTGYHYARGEAITLDSILVGAGLGAVGGAAVIVAPGIAAALGLAGGLVTIDDLGPILEDPNVSPERKIVASTLLAATIFGARAIFRYARPARIPNSLDRVAEAANAIRQWLGPRFRTITNDAGDRVHVSADGLRRVRFDLNNPYPHESAHSHVEVLVNGRWKKSGPIYPTDVTPR